MVAVVSANIALALLVKIMDVRGSQQERIKIARKLMEQLHGLAERDIAAVRKYIATRDPEVLQEAIQVPMEAARATTQGVELCVKVARAVTGLISADVGVAATTLTASTRAVLACVDANAREMGTDLDASLMEERAQLEKRAVHARELVFDELP